MKKVLLACMIFILFVSAKLFADGGVSGIFAGIEKNWISTETNRSFDHYVFSSSKTLYCYGIVISSPGLESSFAMFDSSTTTKVDGNFIHVTTISTSKEAGVVPGTFIPIKKNFGRYGTMFHTQGARLAIIRILYDWTSRDGEDRTIGD